MAKSITKTIRLPDDKMMRKFISCQSSFSSAIRYLVIKYCREAGYDKIADLSQAYSEFLYEVPPTNEPVSKEAPKSTSEAPLRGDFSYSEPTAKESMMTAPISGIPSCYQ